MKKYCEKCGREVDCKIISKVENYEVCGEDIQVNARVLVCTNCEEEFYNETLDNETLLTAYSEYRRRHKLLAPEDIKQIREQYGLSQRSFAKLLNWGDKTVHRYENGAIQDKAHNSLLLFLREPENMKSYLQDNEIMLDDQQIVKIYEAITRMEDNSEVKRSENMMKLMFSQEASIENGFRSFDFEKFCAMIMFFANRGSRLLKVKLMKLLNYADMIYFKENGISISGIKYVHQPYGPVPQNSDVLLGMMQLKKLLHIDVEFDNGYEKHLITPDQNMEIGILNEKELAVLERIYERFKDFSSSQISDYSHKEKGYKETVRGEIISYSYAKDISLN